MQVQDLVTAHSVTVPHLVIHSFPHKPIVQVIMGSSILPGYLRVPKAIGGAACASNQIQESRYTKAYTCIVRYLLMSPHGMDW